MRKLIQRTTIVLRGMAIAFAILLMTQLAVPSAYAATQRYVNPTTGSDVANNCSNSASPCKTLTRAINQSTADDTINLAAGTYSAAANGETLPQTLSINLTITGAGAASTTIDGGNATQVFRVNAGVMATFQNLTIANGRCNCDGAAIYTNLGTVTISNSTLSGNGASNATIYNNWGTMTISNSSFSGNSAFAGGAIHNNSGTVTISNSTFSGNSAGIGGGIYNYDGTVTISNSTFSGNSANISGGAIYYTRGTTTLKNTIVANSTSGGNCNGTITDGGNNLDSANTCGFTAVTSKINTNPNLGALTGSPAYYPLNSGSPAIDAGGNTTCANPPVSNQSQNGVTRPKDGDSNGSVICDIGSYEAPVKIATITTLTGPSGNFTGAQLFTFTATVADASLLTAPTKGRAPAQTGTVTFFDNGVAIPTCTNVPLVGGVASCTVTLGVGTHVIRADYSGDANFAPSTSTITLTLTVAQQVTVSVPVAPVVPKEVPEGDTLLLLGGGIGGLATWLRWQWSKRRSAK